jgi:hypothetical protein
VDEKEDEGGEMMMNRKGQIGMALIIALMASVVVYLIGISMVDTVCSPFCNCIADETAENASITVNGWSYQTCTGDKCDTDYRLLCNGTELEVGTEYEIDDCDYMVTNASYDGGYCTLYYTYEGDYYHGTDVLGIIMCNIPLIMAVAGFLLAGGLVFFKGGE